MSIKTLLLQCTLCVFAFTAINATAVTLYKWVDAEGRISYQDTPPPSGQSYEEKSFTDEGINTQTDPEVDRSRAAVDNPVTLYMTKQCDSCDLVRTTLDLHNIPYHLVDVEETEDAQKKLKEVAGSLRVPSLTIGDEVISGFDRNRIEDTLKQQGYPLSTATN